MRKFVLALVVTAFAPMAPQPSSAAPSPGSIDVKAVAPLAEDATFYRRRYDYDYYPRYRYYDGSPLFHVGSLSSILPAIK